MHFSACCWLQVGVSKFFLSLQRDRSTGHEDLDGEDLLESKKDDYISQFAGDNIRGNFFQYC